MSHSPPILIAGSGIGGASAALALLKKGFDVEVYEQALELTEVGAGVQISPNGARSLDALGVFQELNALSCKPEKKQFRLWNTGRSWPMFDLGDAAMTSYGYPYLTVYRPDLLNVLVDGVRALKPDAVHLGKRATGFSQDADGVTLTLEDGSTARGAALIGADGVRSRIREQMWGGAKPAFSGMITWRAVIPMERLPERLRAMVGNTWIGPGGHVVTYPLRGARLLNFVATIERQDWREEGWNIPGTPEECARDFAGWHADIHEIISCAPSLLKWALMGRDPMPAWTKERVTLLGDACHPTLPFLAQGAVMSIEDGVVMARCVEAENGDLPAAFKRYEAARIDRTRRMVLGARDNTDRFHSSELGTEEGAQVYLEREWGRAPIQERYHWLYQYQSDTVAI
ncbi:FAD-dependent monooxygenase [Hoeflea alexandrii]|uniref:FAD-dependent monooxygenase n=1 Tax=Hoeflea alexandrii TaxID=288436 RepID=UPI0022AF7696|nr:FAD-dependent monooxygenase [Hoeflea alexandrii]MCZ4291607.1 FAD-dependent monooxygenase [Hoeflea alexandrii]